MNVTRPRMPALECHELPDGGRLEQLVLAEALVEHHGRAALATPRIHIEESELRGVSLVAGPLSELLVRDTRLVDCDLSNITARRGELRRVELSGSRLVGFGVGEGDVQDARVSGGTLMLASFSQATLRRVVFDAVNLREATFLEARLTSVLFDGCDLTGADFRGARLKDCTIRGSSLDGVIGVESLRGVTMPWPDLVASVETLAGALGISVEESG